MRTHTHTRAVPRGRHLSTSQEKTLSERVGLFSPTRLVDLWRLLLSTCQAVSADSTQEERRRRGDAREQPVTPRDSRSPVRGRDRQSPQAGGGARPQRRRARTGPWQRPEGSRSPDQPLAGERAHLAGRADGFDDAALKAPGHAVLRVLGARALPVRAAEGTDLEAGGLLEDARGAVGALGAAPAALQDQDARLCASSRCFIGSPLPEAPPHPALGTSSQPPSVRPAGPGASLPHFCRGGVPRAGCRHRQAMRTGSILPCFPAKTH